MIAEPVRQRSSQGQSERGGPLPMPVTNSQPTTSLRSCCNGAERWLVMSLCCYTRMWRRVGDPSSVRSVYLSDTDIRELLPVLDIHAGDDAYPFDAESQIQPCSIDLRLSPVFWKPSRRVRHTGGLLPRRGVTVDLRQSAMHELSPRWGWRQLELSEGSTITLGPGQIVMARIYERFAIPPSCAGKVEGRSSYARLGLFVHCSGDFINPGWSGFMPLQLFNAGPYPLKVGPFLPVCQLKLVQLSSTPARSYGNVALQSKYVNDDGGPSFWWRDQQVQKVRDRLACVSVTDQIQREITDLIRFQRSAAAGAVSALRRGAAGSDDQQRRRSA